VCVKCVTAAGWLWAPDCVTTDTESDRPGVGRLHAFGWGGCTHKLGDGGCRVLQPADRRSVRRARQRQHVPAACLPERSQSVNQPIMMRRARHLAATAPQ
jgi:hypothetical protein